MGSAGERGVGGRFVALLARAGSWDWAIVAMVRRLKRKRCMGTKLA
jgi:hypothetical protein